MKEERIKSSSLMSNGCGSSGSDGSLNNQMYRNVCCHGYYTPVSGRQKNRFHKRMKGVCISQKKNFWDF